MCVSIALTNMPLPPSLPITMTNSALEQLFAPHVVVSLRILTDYEGVSRGVGFVRLRDRDIAQECIDRLHGKVSLFSSYFVWYSS